MAAVKVLIVEDQRMFAEVLQQRLDREPDLSVVGWAGTGEDAVSKARALRPHVVLMDFGLPDTDGATAAERILREIPEAKVVILTQAVDESVLLRALEAGCAGYLTKQRPVDELVAAVRAVDRGEALISPAMLARLLPRLRRGGAKAGGLLTARELEVLRLVADGLPTEQIADRLTLSTHTVRNHIQRTMGKLGAHSRLEAVVTAAKLGVLR